jgi:diaminopimelate epimerase (EC 5.1.1.7)
MPLPFTKMHGLGNDFVVVDATRQPFPAERTLLARIADRHRGIGCDQILVVEPPPSPDVDFGYRIYNADGSEVGQCGNGARCLARYVREHALSVAKTLRIATRSARMTLELLDDGRVRVDMGVPRLEPAAIPLAVPQQQLRYPLHLPGQPALHFGAVSMGNPHAVFEVDQVDSAPVLTVGMALQKHPLFPERVNVGFAQFVNRSRMRLRVHERGAGETQACGSGACAAAVIGRLWGRLDARVTVELRGGELEIEWAGGNATLWMTGPAETVYEGTLN